MSHRAWGLARPHARSEHHALEGLGARGATPARPPRRSRTVCRKVSRDRRDALNSGAGSLRGTRLAVAPSASAAEPSFICMQLQSHKCSQFYPVGRAISAESTISCDPLRRATSAKIRCRTKGGLRWHSAFVSGLGRNVRQPDRVLANSIAGYKAERRPGAGEEWLAATKHDGMEVESILINKTKVS